RSETAIMPFIANPQVTIGLLLAEINRITPAHRILARARTRVGSGGMGGGSGGGRHRRRWGGRAARRVAPGRAQPARAAHRRVQAQVGPEGDEPHYLMVADSLLRDHDLSLERDYAEGRYRAFHPAPLEPHYRVRGRGGEIYSLHAVGLSLLVLPAYALAGYAG